MPLIQIRADEMLKLLRWIPMHHIPKNYIHALNDISAERPCLMKVSGD